MKKHLLNLAFLAGLLILTTSNPAHAARVFIFFDGACMDRLEYANAKNGEPYVVYHINIGQGEKLILEVGKESKDLQSTLPLSYVSCSNGRFDAGMAKRINSDADDVFVIFEITQKQYLVSPVTVAAYYTQNNQQIAYESPKYAFKFDTQHGTIGENISSNASAEVYFEGRLENACTGSFIFRQKSKGKLNTQTQADLVFVPEIGVTEERIGFNAQDAQQNALTLKKIKGREPDQYLMDLCRPGTSANIPVANNELTPKQGYDKQEIPQSFEMTENPLPPSYDSPTTTPAKSNAAANSQYFIIAPAKGGNTLPPPTAYNNAATSNKTVKEKTPDFQIKAGSDNSNSAEFHTVQKGETLYGLSKKYNTSVEKLREWNNLGTSNNIKNGSQLRVAAPGAKAQTSNNAQGGTQQPATNNFPAPYEETGNRLTEKSGEEVRYHIVKPGETVASLAIQYGYTETRFREMNNMGKSDYLKIGQKLKVSDCVCPENTGMNQPYYPPADAKSDIPKGYDDLGGRTDLTPKTPYATPQTQQAINSNTGTYGGQYNDVAVPTIITQTGQWESSSNNNASRKASGPADDAFGATYYSDEAVMGDRIPTDNGFDTRLDANKSGDRFDYYPSYQPPNERPSEFGTPQTYNDVTPKGTRRVHIVKEGESLSRISKQYNISLQRLAELNNLELNEALLPFQRIYLD